MCAGTVLILLPLAGAASGSALGSVSAPLRQRSAPPAASATVTCPCFARVERFRWRVFLGEQVIP